MDYALAMELKDAGWPQGDRAREGDLWGGDPLQYVRVPTLEELFEACGEGYFDLERSHAGWRALKGGVFYSSHCTTHRAAVARLFLALNRTEAAKS